MLVSPAEPPAFRSLGVVSSAPEKVGADFLMSAAGGKLLGCQRKEFNDLLASVQGGERLAKEMLQMSQLSFSVLLVEGRGHWTRDGNLIDRYRHFSRSQLTRLFASVMSKGTWVIQTDDMEDTIRTLHDLEAWAKKDAHTALTQRGTVPTSWGKPTSREWLLFFLQGLPTIGPEKAARILKHFDGRVPIHWSCTYEDLLDIPGFGKKTVDLIWQALPEPPSGKRSAVDQGKRAVAPRSSRASRKKGAA